MTKLRSFAPVIAQSSKVLILGSMPGQESLKKQEYYAHPRNQFWKVIFAFFKRPVEDNYIQKIKFLQEKRIALWDVIAVCHRVGSLDANIKEERANDFNSLFNEYPNITYVAFNGSKAYEVFKKNVGFEFPGICFKKLKSTSPANTIKFELKLKDWQNNLGEVLSKTIGGGGMF